MAQEQQPTGFFNRASVVLFLVFTIPTVLTLAGMYYVVIQGRIPGGEDSYCETNISASIHLRIDLYAYTAGLVNFESQTFSVSEDGENWNELFSDTIPVPDPIECDTAYQLLDEQNIVLQNQKSLAWSSDAGMTWHVHRVCDDPRPTGGRCDAESLIYAEVDLNTDGTGTVRVIESEVDEFGEPQRDANNNPLVDNQWQLLTENAGEIWTLQRAE